MTTKSLAAEEQKFLYNLEVLGMPPERAAVIAGITDTNYPNILARPDVQLAREKMRGQLRQSVQLTREDVINGYKEAIDMARIINEPMPMIAGWTAISKLLGFDKPQEVNITINGDVREVRRQIRAMPEVELLKLADENSIIDGDFYPVDDK